MTAFVGSTNVLELFGYRETDEAEYINDATVTVTIRETADPSSDPIAGETWPKSMPYIAASNGVYRAVLSDGLSLVDRGVYYAHVTATSADGVSAWAFRFRARERLS